jgi:hypothetical protein
VREKYYLAELVLRELGGWSSLRRRGLVPKLSGVTGVGGNKTQDFTVSEEHLIQSIGDRY